MSSGRSKAAALKALKEKRANRLQGLGASRTEEYEVPDEGDVYDVVEESEYEHLVEKRRQREDFVVDDDGLGYHDDGEEVVGMGDTEEDDGRSKNKKKRSGAAASITADTLKRARRANAMLRQKEDAAQQDEKDADSGAMWAFVSRGATAVAASSASASQQPNAAPSANLESLLDDLYSSNKGSTRDASSRRASAPRRRPAHSQGGGSRSSYGRRAPASSVARSRQFSRRDMQTPTPGKLYARRMDFEQEADEEEEQAPTNNFDDGDDDDEDIGNDWNPEEEMNTDPIIKEEKNDNVAMDDVEDVASSPVSMAAVNEETQESNDKAADSETAPSRPRKRLAVVKSKLGRSLVAMKKVEQNQSKTVVKETVPEVKEQQPLAITVDTNSSSFKPAFIAAEGDEPHSEAAAAAAAANLDTITKVDEETNEKYTDMFWIDACEKNGVVYLYGKVEVVHNSGKDNKKPQSSFVSCCVVVRNNLRSLFVLPRRKNGSDPNSGDELEYESMADVHKEMNSVLKPKCIPLVEGASWRGKPVNRKYAFADISVPREETTYMKVQYDAKYDVPSPEVCEQGGQFFSKIFGAGASTLENFILKRRLMGPCWIKIRNPMPNKAPASWCKIELQVANPKDISPIVSPMRHPPPVVTMTIKIKTVVNPSTHKSEVVSVSAICHKRVLLDTASDESNTNMTQISLIRPLGQASSGMALAQFPRDFDNEVKNGMSQLQRMPNERALLSRLFTQIGLWDPDVLVGHNIWGYDLQLLLSRCTDLKVMAWSKIGRRRKQGLPLKNQFTSGKGDWALVEAVSGRIVCDTYISAKDLLNETTYSLDSLAKSQLKTQREDILPIDVPQFYNSSDRIVKLARHTLNDAQLVQRLMFKLQILPLSKQLTCISGNLWARTMKGNRAERNDFLLLHEFHNLKYIVPEKKRKGTMETEKGAKYSGGLVLEPKKGFYDSFILLLDFNSLYPSIIQEYNLCFTTLNWSSGGVAEVKSETPSGEDYMVPLPDESVKQGVLPRVIKTLVERRRNVKKLLKQEKNAEKCQELDIRQKALKLTANSMYGCLGFSYSRFFAQSIAARVTGLGRETLQRTVDLAEKTLGLEVIYGDTDSIMINTRIKPSDDLSEVMRIGEQVKKESNGLYKTLELEIDGIFKSMLLLKKKKYAAITVTEGSDGKIIYNTETKGLDLVRRDWCIQSKDTGRYILDQILSGQERESVVEKIHDHLEDLAKRMRAAEVPLEKYVITKGLSKHPNEYPDGKSQAHVHVAKMMLKNQRAVNTGDHIPYIITAPLDEEDEQGSAKPKKAPTAVERARHPEEIIRSGGILKPDIEWYLTQQILPPISRLCEPLDGTSQSIIAQKLGLDTSKYQNMAKSNGVNIDDDDLVDYTPACNLPDDDRFKDTKKLLITCGACNDENEFPGVFYLTSDSSSGKKVPQSGMLCVNPECPGPQNWGRRNSGECLATLANALNLLAKKATNEYYQGCTKCDDPSCGLETKQLSLASMPYDNNTGGYKDVVRCLRRGCEGHMHPKYTERALFTQVKYIESLFDIEHVSKQLQLKYPNEPINDAKKTMSKRDKMTWAALHEWAATFLDRSDYNWVSPDLFAKLFVNVTR
uniref:DNA polymerase n=1 Tax=Attheya septentrionalis TaxID=420275 RepID=A0A7S2UH04_9STRA|mmetsp:Transcript_22230/g.40061  ORF Transcript_22230/g.40061 Transcript_22230/m.40061 type:complete len:1605 (+) Transcript_22230:77-4891(+)|eukprot:CAMPEP_0198289202 /NCGR_PEP_ID=MMETSP1449-20131203/7478_1 /TAXON_ID=420275 /ORGANISM="Attheya septentrionalis, Strain CCMP2084" /LENGTH=1604 /DNA_ID=CAMNT_0043987499 /DNA_START=1 /DNA_END=4815 /DNA_ORIENTATION=-